MIAEPEVVAPESVFEDAIVRLVEALVQQAGCGCLVIPKFGLDVALFLKTDRGVYSRFLEVKVFAAARPGGVGFGGPRGEGPQVELLCRSDSDLRLVDDTVRWVLADSTLAPGTARYALFNSRTARAAAMGEVGKGKQSNLRVGALKAAYLTWTALLQELRRFLFEPAEPSRS